MTNIVHFSEIVTLFGEKSGKFGEIRVAACSNV